MADQFKAAIRTIRTTRTADGRPGETAWEMTADTDLILRTADDDVVFAATLDEAKAELDRRFPSDLGPRFSRIRLGPCSRAENMLWVGDDSYPLTEDLTELCELARELGRVKLSWEVYHRHAYNSERRQEKAGCILENLSLVYDPARARRRARANDRRRDTATVLVGRDDVAGCVMALAGTLRSYGYWFIDYPPTSSWRDAVASLEKIVHLYNRVFGTEAHRRRHQFIGLLKKWRTNPAGNAKRMTQLRHTAFADWLGKQATGPLPRPVDPADRRRVPLKFSRVDASKETV